MNNFYQPPYSGGVPPWQSGPMYAPPTPQEEEKRHLRRDGNYIGGVLLAQTAAMNLTFIVVSLVLMLFGVIGQEQLSAEYMGLGNTVYLLMYAGVYAFAMAVPAVLVSLCCKKRHFPLTPAASLNAWDAFFALLGGMGLCMVANYVANYIAAFLTQFGIDMPEMPQMMEPTGESLLLNIVVLAVLPALLEELVFRGYILRALRPYGDTFAVCVSAVIFGLVHGNILQVPFALLVGAVLGWLYVRTNNIWLAVAVHFCNNAFSVVLEYFALGVSEQSANVMYVVSMLTMLVVGLGAVGILAVRRSDLLRLPKQEKPALLSLGQRLSGLLKSPVLVVAVLVLLLLIVVEALL